MQYSDENEGVSRAQNADGKPHAKGLFAKVVRVLRVKHYSLRTEQAYLGWVRRFILGNGRRHPREMGGAEAEAFLSDLAVHGQVAASTQNQALSALLFLYREVLGIKLPWMDAVIRAKRSQRVPTVLSRDEVTRLLAFQQPLTSAVIGTRE